MICAIILAAGDSSRMGKLKALLDLDGRTFLEIACEKARCAGIPDITVVLGKHSESIKLGWKNTTERVIVNPNPDYGQLSSLREALKHLPADAESAFISLVDQPLVAVSTYRKIVDCWKERQESVIIPRFKGKRGHPVILPRPVWRLCFEGPLDKGLHWVIHHESVKVTDLAVEDGAILKDIDTPEDYRGIGGRD